MHIVGNFSIKKKLIVTNEGRFDECMFVKFFGPFVLPVFSFSNKLLINDRN